MQVISDEKVIRGIKKWLDVHSCGFSGMEGIVRPQSQHIAVMPRNPTTLAAIATAWQTLLLGRGAGNALYVFDWNHECYTADATAPGFDAAQCAEYLDSGDYYVLSDEGAKSGCYPRIYQGQVVAWGPVVEEIERALQVGDGNNSAGLVRVDASKGYLVQQFNRIADEHAETVKREREASVKAAVQKAKKHK
eukprot:GDKI01003401.1.p1 GENE.GDKI01003401.1~~GDKI01003401.1.p1  ORF type:complete len:192 (+),score=61.28 GDKI01003401.1:123-698(+)